MDERLSMSAVAGLVNAAASIVAQTELPDVLKQVAETARQLTGARYAALGVIGDYGSLTEFIHVGLDRKTADEIGALPTGKGVLGLLIREGETIRLDEIAAHPDSFGFPANHPPMHSFLGVPVQVGSRIFGNIYLTEKEGGFTDHDETTVQALAIVAGAAVGTSRLRQRLDTLALTDERERIARNVHDSVVQDLFAVGLSLQALASKTEEEAFANELEGIADRVDAAIGSLRALILDLRSDDTSKTLRQIIEEITEELAGPFGTPVQVEVNHAGFLPSGRLLEDILAIAQEGTANALKHARASLVLLKVDQIGSNVMVSVVDDGIGFDPATERSGMGLANIEARVRNRGGTVDMTTAPDGGTILEAVIPINPADRS